MVLQNTIHHIYDITFTKSPCNSRLKESVFQIETSVILPENFNLNIYGIMEIQGFESNYIRMYLKEYSLRKK